MVSAISHYDILITTQHEYECGGPPKIFGSTFSSGPAEISGGFLLYEDLSGAKCGLNLQGVLHYAFVPAIDLKV